ncbi:hypothetical protein ACTWPB_07745 [Nocardia sp. IBHARD005]|uniref:hypothetical protein n=1 Tax=Nocardia sp. IBHARD005 TaxID=3457765 RepID=UPI004059751E
MTTTVTYVLTHSKSRPRQMHILARALTDRYGVPFTAAYQESTHDWRIDWSNGPTEEEVRGILTRLAAGLPAVTSLTLSRGYTDLAEATALLMWIDADPTRLTDVSSYWSCREAFGSTRFPERAPEVWIARAQRLLEVGHFHTAGLDWLRARDWATALGDLDAATPAPTLNASALRRLEAAGVTVADWAKLNHMSGGQWCGDVCGCPDDRCIGRHHAESSECGCLGALLAVAVRS